MYSITDEEIEFILDDITKKGIVTEDVRDNILDHVCCIIENELERKVDFNEFYSNTIAKFYKKELSEIEAETKNLLTFKNYYAMKRTLKISGLISIVLIIFGAILKAMHLSGAGITLVLGFAIFSFLFIPLNVIMTLKDDQKTSDKVVMTIGMLVTLTGTISLVFKVMQWPMANLFFIGSLAAFGLIFIPLYFFTKFRNPETKFNAIINTTFMIAAAGMIFTLIQLRGNGKESIESQTQSNLIEQFRESSQHLLESNDKIDSNSDFVSLSNDLLSNIEELKKNPGHENLSIEEFKVSIDAYNNMIDEFNNGLLKRILYNNHINFSNLDLYELQVLANKNSYFCFPVTQP